MIGMKRREERKAKQLELAAAVRLVTEHYPGIAPIVQGRVNHVKRRYVGLVAIALATCELVAVVLG